MWDGWDNPTRHLHAMQPLDVRPDDSPYRIEAAAAHRRDAALLRRWRALLAASESSERIFQSPEFFDYLAACATDEEGVELIVVRARASGEVVGVVPVRLRVHSFDFTAGRHALAAVAIPSIVLLSSVPLLPAEDGALDAVLQFLLAAYPRCQAISMTSLPFDSSLWRCISGSDLLRRRYRRHLLHDWRACHRIPLPHDFPAYLQQLSAKRRYNLGRQLRLLREHGGDRLVLHCIERPEQVERLLTALRTLTPPQRRRQLLSDTTLRELAQRGLLLCHVLECAGQPCAVMLGLAYDGVLYLHNILHDSALGHLSPGTVLLHQVIEQLCARGHFRVIDLGYGTPAYGYQSSNVTVQRAHLLMLRPSLKNRLACRLHQGFCVLAGIIKRWKS